MEPQNTSTVTNFQLLGFQNLLEWQTLLFVIFLLIYCLTITGNVVIITVVSQDKRLHSPMYMFLQHLSFLEVWYTSTTVPLLLANLLSWGQAISFSACMAQLYFFVFLGATECFLLAIMAYDRYLAICSPLRYPFLMHPLDVYITEVTIFILSIAVLCICFFLTLGSYVFIVSSVLRIPSTSGRRKTFSTCGSHLAVVTIYYGTMISMYVHPSPHLLPAVNKIISVFYTVVTPLLNPVIYSSRNKDFKEAVRKLMRRKCGIYGVRAKGSSFISSSHSLLHFHVLQAVNERIQSRVDDRIEQGDQFVSLC
ncbi:hypothetical protein H8958_014460 [Nasalis larvatus]